MSQVFVQGHHLQKSKQDYYYHLQQIDYTVLDLTLLCKLTPSLDKPLLVDAAVSLVEVDGLLSVVGLDASWLAAVVEDVVEAVVVLVN